MSGLADRASVRGLPTRAPNAADGRAVDVLLTAAGATLAAGLFAQVTASLLPVVGARGPADQRRLHRLLAAMLGP